MAEGSSFFMYLSAKLGLDKAEFDQNLSQAESDAENFKGPEADDLKLNTSDFTTKVADAQKKTESFGSVASQLFGDIATKLVASGIASLIGSFTQGVVDLINLSKNLGQEVKSGADALGISTKAYQQWDYVLKQTGGSVSDLETGVESVGKLLSGNADERLSAAFKDLGVSATDAWGNVRDVEDVLDDTIRAISQLPDGKDKSDLISTIFGRDDNLRKMLEQDTLLLENMKRTASESGYVLGEDQINASVAYNEAVTNLSNSVSVLKETVARDLAQPLTTVVNGLTSVAMFFGSLGRGDQSLSGLFEGADKELTENYATIEATGKAALDIVDKLFAMGDAEKLTAEQAAEWKANAEWLVKNIPSLSGVIDTDTGSITANKDEVHALVEEWRNYSRERALAQVKQAKLAALTNEQGEVFDQLAEAEMMRNNRKVVENQMVEYANQLLENNEDFKNRIEGELGYSSIDRTAENAGDLASYVLTRSVGVEGLKVKNAAGELENAGWKTGIDLVNQYDDLEAKISETQAKADEAKAELDEMMANYEAWVSAVDAIAGTASESAAEASESAGALGEEAQSVAGDYGINFILNTYGSMPDLSGFNKLGPINPALTRPKAHDAKGEWDVPYDDYPAVLHRDEMVLNASRARKYRESESGSSLDMTALAAAVVVAIREGMSEASVNSYLDGKGVTGGVNRRTMNQLKARRFAT